MRTQTLFRAGNSNVVAIPQEFMRELGIKTGAKVVVAKVPYAQGILIRKASAVRSKSRSIGVEKEFQRWLRQALKEDGEILDELAVH